MLLNDDELGKLEAWAKTTWHECPPVLGIDYLKLAEGLFATIATIRELRPLAKLGRMVKEMPVHSLICHESHVLLGEWYAELPVGKWFFNKEYGATPEDALDAASKEKDGG